MKKTLEKKIDQKYGFTLLELIVVISVIGILVSIAMPNMFSVRQSAKEAVLKSNMHVVATALEQYHLANDEYPLENNEANFKAEFLPGGEYPDNPFGGVTTLNFNGSPTNSGDLGLADGSDQTSFILQGYGAGGIIALEISSAFD